MSQAPRHRPLSVGPIRAFEAVARHLSFRIAAEELFLTQSAISRQIQSLEDEIGAALFSRGTRHVALTADGAALLAAVAPALQRLDAGVRQLRSARGRRGINVSTFASFASLWLLPRIEAYQREHSQLDIRIDTGDRLVDLDDPETEVVIRYIDRSRVPENAVRLFGETVTPAASPRLVELAAAGQAPPLDAPADLARYTLVEEDDHRPAAQFLTWRHWLAQQGLAKLEPQRWLYLNYTYQQVQAALAGHGVVLARLPLVAESIARGELVELFGGTRRIVSPLAYWLLIGPASAERPEVKRFAEWIRQQARATCAAIADVTPA
ncbi:MAG TPA: LysR family transcriptional regulator [Methylibium sp.]|nr:LysR family transcriptional regulator [Methylibium sp.]HEU4457880.1 LysR family transcriptional regulator [Methylibium sp.]